MEKLKLPSLGKSPSDQHIKTRPRLDFSRLMGRNGFPYLLKNQGTLRFNNDGDEEYNLNVLINFYREWSDLLFPRLKYEDVVKTIERQCRKKEFRHCIEELFRVWKGIDRNHEMEEDPVEEDPDEDPYSVSRQKREEALRRLGGQ